MGRHAQQSSSLMSGNDLPYRLRPNKFIDRELFAELVAKLAAAESPQKFAYISMGGKHLNDHLAIYRRSGIRNLYAFDFEKSTSDRQEFNAPFEDIVCRTHGSEEVPTRLGQILEEFGAERSIIWLDFTKPKRLSQLKEVEDLAKHLQPGDIIRVTFNADFASLEKCSAQLKKADKLLEGPQRNAALLRVDLGGYLPNKVKEIYHNRMTDALSLAVERALSNGLESVDQGFIAQPLLLTEYQDSNKMFVATALIQDSTGFPAVPNSWSLIPENWTNIERIHAPDLSIRERHALDRLINKDSHEIAENLVFELEQDAIESYVKFQRFYPIFQPLME